MVHEARNATCAPGAPPQNSRLASGRHALTTSRDGKLAASVALRALGPAAPGGERPRALPPHAVAGRHLHRRPGAGHGRGLAGRGPPHRIPRLHPGRPRLLQAAGAPHPGVRQDRGLQRPVRRRGGLLRGARGARPGAPRPGWSRRRSRRRLRARRDRGWPGRGALPGDRAARLGGGAHPRGVCAPPLPLHLGGLRVDPLRGHPQDRLRDRRRAAHGHRPRPPRHHGLHAPGGVHLPDGAAAVVLRGLDRVSGGPAGAALQAGLRAGAAVRGLVGLPGGVPGRLPPPAQLWILDLGQQAHDGCALGRRPRLGHPLCPLHRQAVPGLHDQPRQGRSRLPHQAARAALRHPVPPRGDGALLRRPLRRLPPHLAARALLPGVPALQRGPRRALRGGRLRHLLPPRHLRVRGLHGPGARPG